ncbi:hypothetical protein LEL_09930 [Akanthomyces lecanii RCEF 1005]|uniref:Uncharacterized protein n=1 Tax=Akanthomyces lecanii RCEF 1005 TaxID=1081108 RepID=A0A162LG32_CORDF|nr:hypothetical protein LEL_09930 [Akanthomyces lecanii RCEF 1005]
MAAGYDEIDAFLADHPQLTCALFAAALIDDKLADEDYRRQKSFADRQDKGCVCPEDNRDARRTRCHVCVFANEEACKWDRKSCSD